MRLERLDLAPYGQFTEHALRLRPEAALHVVLGENESGKTTTLSALGDLLYGFPKDTDYAFQHDQKLLRVGGVFRLADGTRLELRRRKGNKDTLLDAADRPISEEPLRAALAGIGRETFRAEFGLTSQKLREGGRALLAAGGSLAESLAAGSASLSRLNAARIRLEGEADVLFGARRAATKPFYVAADRHAEADRRLRDAIVTPDALALAEDAVREALAREIDLKAQYQERGRSIARRRRAQRVAGKLVRLDAISGECAELADLPALAAPARAEARAAISAEAAARVEAERLAEEDARDGAARRGLGVDEALLARAAEIDELASQLGAVRKDEEDLPRRVGAQAQVRGQLEDLARRLGLSDHAALLAFAPPDAAIARVRALAAQRRETERKRADAAQRLAAAQAEKRRLGETASAARDPAPLKRRLDGFADALGEAERLRGDRARMRADAKALEEAFAALDPAPADLDALARAALPDEAALAARERAEGAAEETFRTAARTREDARRALDGAQAELARRESAAAGATRADWDAARARREAALDRLEAALDGPPDARRERFETTRAAAHAADATVESVLADTSRAARLQSAREALDERKGDFARAETAAAGAETARERAAVETAAIWRKSGLAPRQAAEMTRWRKTAAAILAQRATLNDRKADLDSRDEKIAAARDSLAGWLTDAGASGPAPTTFEEAHRTARARLEELVELKQAALEVEAQRARAEREIAEWAAEQERAEAAAERLRLAWGPAAAALQLAPDAMLEEGEAALEAWALAPLPRREFEDATHRIAAMRADIASFERAVGALAAAVAAPLAALPARETLPRLVGLLAAGRRAADERDRLDRAAAEREVRRGGLEAERMRVAAALARARQSANAPDDANLAAALDRIDRRASLEDERERLKRELVEIGDGLDEAKLRGEQANLDLASLPAEIELAEQGQALALQAIGEAAAEVSRAEARLQALHAGRDAVGAARDRTEAAAEMLDLAERWLVRAAAGALAGRAVERHRAAAQDPLIARAGHFFAVATAGRYAGLGVGYDSNDNPVLEARPPQGRPVGIDGLSEGARDQLFLSLRLALLERRAGEPLPFLGDDLLASFDDGRTRRTLELLAEFGAKRQTILFTHHARVAELARGLAGVEIVEM